MCTGPPKPPCWATKGHVGRPKVRLFLRLPENEVMQKETHDLETINDHSSLRMVVLILMTGIL